MPVHCQLRPLSRAAVHPPRSCPSPVLHTSPWWRRLSKPAPDASQGPEPTREQRLTRCQPAAVTSATATRLTRSTRRTMKRYGHENVVSVHDPTFQVHAVDAQPTWGVTPSRSVSTCAVAVSALLPTSTCACRRDTRAGEGDAADR